MVLSGLLVLSGCVGGSPRLSWDARMSAVGCLGSNFRPPLRVVVSGFAGVCVGGGGLPDTTSCGIFLILRPRQRCAFGVAISHHECWGSRVCEHGLACLFVQPGSPVAAL